MDYITLNDVRELIDVNHYPCISLSFQTHRSGVETHQDPIRLKNLIRDAENQLEEMREQPQSIRHLLQPLHELVDEHAFWHHQSDGLEIFRSPDLFRRFRVPFAVPELAIVADRFHLKPLLPALETNQRAYLICLSQEAVKVFELSPEGLSEVEVPDMPEGPLLNPPQLSGRSNEAERKRLLSHHFRSVDHAVRTRINGEHAPIILAGLVYLCALYRQSSMSPVILPGEIHGNSKRLRPADLHRHAWAIASAHLLDLRRKAAEEYLRLRHTHRTSDDLATVVAAAQRGTVKTLFVALDSQKWGRLDPRSSKVLHDDSRSIQDEDLLNLAAIQTLTSGGAAFAVPPDQVPGRGSVAAVLRY